MKSKLVLLLQTAIIPCHTAPYSYFKNCQDFHDLEFIHFIYHCFSKASIASTKCNQVFLTPGNRVFILVHMVRLVFLWQSDWWKIYESQSDTFIKVVFTSTQNSPHETPWKTMPKPRVKTLVTFSWGYINLWKAVLFNHKFWAGLLAIHHMYFPYKRMN